MSQVPFQAPASYEAALEELDQLVGLIQQKYGYTREHAEEEFNRRINEAKAKHAKHK